MLFAEERCGEGDNNEDKDDSVHNLIYLYLVAIVFQLPLSYNNFLPMSTHILIYLYAWPCAEFHVWLEYAD